MLWWTSFSHLTYLNIAIGLEAYIKMNGSKSKDAAPSKKAHSSQHTKAHNGLSALNSQTLRGGHYNYPLSSVDKTA